MIMAFWFILDFHRCLALQNTAIQTVVTYLAVVLRARLV